MLCWCSVYLATSDDDNAGTGNDDVVTAAAADDGDDDGIDVEEKDNDDDRYRSRVFLPCTGTISILYRRGVIMDMIFLA